MTRAACRGWAPHKGCAAASRPRGGRLAASRTKGMSRSRRPLSQAGRIFRGLSRMGWVFPGMAQTRRGFRSAVSRRGAGHAKRLGGLQKSAENSAARRGGMRPKRANLSLLPAVLRNVGVVSSDRRLGDAASGAAAMRGSDFPRRIEDEGSAMSVRHGKKRVRAEQAFEMDRR